MEDRRAKLAELSAKARALPRSPGVYLMKDDRGRVIYVGKARILPHRVATYFQPAADLGPKKQPMIDLIDDFDILECQGEWEALLAENRLIKDLHPKFNARLTDDKTFPYLVITMRDDFPGVYITREPTADRYRGAKVIGPFTSVYTLREAMKLLQRVFQFRTCELEIRADDQKRRFFRPCLLHAIRQCTAPCADRIDRRAYRQDIDRFVRFVQSRRSVMLRQMRQEMADAAADRRFEQAAALRDQIQAIEKLDERGRISAGWQPETESFCVDPRRGLRSLARALGLADDPRCIECIDIAHLQGRQTVGAKVCFVDGRPCKDAYRRYRIASADNDDYAAIREVVSRAYRDAGAGQAMFPDLLVIDGGRGQLAAALDALEPFDHRPAAVIALAKAQETIHQPGRDAPLRLSRQNPGLKLCQAIRDEAHRFAQHYHHILRRRTIEP
jgi:excinuclease ABC subunit C